MKPRTDWSIDRRIFETAAQRIERRWNRRMYVLAAVFAACVIAGLFKGA